MAAKKNTPPSTEVTEILEVNQGEVVMHLVGLSPLIMNRMSEKAKHELLLPRGRKSATEKATSLKHKPVEEFRASVYRLRDESRASYLAMLSTAIKGALRSAAIDMPGAKKAQIGRLAWITGEHVDVFGVPKLFMSIVRSADMNKTPDVRTRAILPEWACRVVVTFVRPLIRPQAIVNLMASAGLTIGIGDWRPEKGSGNYGQFRVVSADDADFLRITKSGGRQVQIDALETPECYDDETAELLAWYDTEVGTRTLRGVA